MLLTLFGMLFDFEHNRPLVSESRPVGLDADTIAHEPIRATIETAPLDIAGGSRPAGATSLAQEVANDEARIEHVGDPRD
jgi:hypothetical protein